MALLKKHLFAPWQITAVRIFLGFVFLGGGMSKLFPGFPGLMGPVWLEAKLAQYDLGMFARFIAFSQAVIGWLLLTRRFSTLGAVMLVPMLLNIFMITISQNWKGTPYVIAVFLLMNIYLLIADYHKLKFLITDDVQPLKKQPLVRKSCTADALCLLALALLLIGGAYGKNNYELAQVFVFSGVSLGVLAPVVQWWRKRKNAAPEIVT